MSKIRIDTTGVVELKGKVTTIKSQAGSAQSYISQARSGIDINTAASENVSYRINRLYSRIQSQQAKLRQYDSTLAKAIEMFMSSDKLVANQAKDVNYLLDKMIASPFALSRNSLNIDAEELGIVDLLCLFSNGTHEFTDKLWELLKGAGAFGILFSLINGTEVDATGLFNSAFSDRTWFGAEYDADKRELDGWIGKADTEINADTYYAGVNAYLGKLEVKQGSVDTSLYQTKTKREYEDGKWTEKEITTYLNVAAEIGASFSILSGDAKFSTGDDMLGAEAKIEGGAGNARADAKGQLSLGEDGVNAYVKGEAIVSAVEGKALGTINILGIEITVKASGYAGALGVEGEVGIKNGNFVLYGGGAAGIGGAVGIEVGINETGWDNFVDFITFWD